MSSETVGFIGVGLLLVFLGMGMPIALAAALTGFLGIWYLAGSTAALGILSTIPYSKTAFYPLTVLPLFILMGYFAFYAGLPAKAFEAGKRWLGHIPGGLALATVGANAAFGACCGSSLAAVSVMGKITLPEMEKLHYKPRLAAGVVAAAGTLAALIPPSGVAVVYAIFAEVSVGKMLLGGIFPGILTALLFGLMLYTRVRRNPSLAGEVLPLARWRDRFETVPQLWGVAVIAGVIIGGIYSGIFTPTEAGAVSSVFTLLLLLTRKSENKWTSLKGSLLDTGRTMAMIFLVMIGVVIFATFIAMSRLPYAVIEKVALLTVDRYVILVGIIVMYIFLGMFFEMIGMLLLSLPVVLPIINNLGFDPIWFGVIVVKTIEVGVLTPPVGLNVYVTKSIAPHIPLEDIFYSIIPFLLMDFVCIVLMVLFPQIILFLPSKMIE